MIDNLTVIVPPPQAPCQECVEDARHQDEQFGLVWCSHVRYGGIYQVEIAQWSIVGPFDDEACFRRSLYNSFARKLMSKST